MSEPRKIHVRARAGLVVDFHRGTLTAPGGNVAKLYGAGVKSSKHPGDAPIEVPLDHNVRKRLRAGDLEQVEVAQVAEAELEQMPVAVAERMLAPLELDDGPDLRPRLPGLPAEPLRPSTTPPGVPSSGGKQEA